MTIRYESVRITLRHRTRVDILTEQTMAEQSCEMAYFGILSVQTLPDVGLEVVIRLPEVGSSSDILGDALGGASST